jgi:hypothetical protein
MNPGCSDGKEQEGQGQHDCHSLESQGHLNLKTSILEDGK